MAAYGGTGTVSGSDYGSLSKNDAFKFQQKMLPIAMKLLTFSRFAQRDVKPLKEGLELRFRRYEKIPYTGRDVPIAEGVTPDFDTISHRTYLTTLQRFGTFVNVTDLMLAVSHDPILNQITDRLGTFAGELKDFLDYKVFRAGTSVAHAVASGATDARTHVSQTIYNDVGLTDNGYSSATPDTNLIDVAIRTLENNDAEKLTEFLKASPGIATQPLRPAFIAVTHPDLRQDIENLPSFISAESYSDPSDRMEGEIGQCKGVRFVLTTQATPFADAATSITAADNTLKSTSGTNPDVYPVLIMAQNFGGTATLAGRDSLRPKVSLPSVSPSDPMGQRGTCAVDFFHAGKSSISINMLTNVC